MKLPSFRTPVDSRGSHPLRRCHIVAFATILMLCGACTDNTTTNTTTSTTAQPSENPADAQNNSDLPEAGPSPLTDDTESELTKALSAEILSDDPTGVAPLDEEAAKALQGAGSSIVEDFDFAAAGDTKFVESADEDFQTEDKSYCLGRAEIPTPQPEITLPRACEMISNRLASVSRNDCDAAQLQPSQCYSVNGFPILFREFPPLESRVPQGRILVIGGTHGDELTSVSVVFRWIEKLNKHHSGLFHWRVAPMMNPDGVLQKAAQRTNINGVDLNRNLPSDDWEENALKYWRNKQYENPRRYPGKNAGSEPETQWLIDELASFKPHAIISVHAPYGVVDYDALVLNVAPKSLGKLTLNLLGTYPGSLGNYAGMNLDIPVITLELPHAWEMPSEEESTKIWEDIVSWLRKNINNLTTEERAQAKRLDAGASGQSGLD